MKLISFFITIVFMLPNFSFAQDIYADFEDAEVELNYPEADCSARYCEYSDYQFEDFDPEESLPGTFMPFCRPGTAPDYYKISLNLNTSGKIESYGEAPDVDCKACLSQHVQEIESQLALPRGENESDDAKSCFYVNDEISSVIPCPATSTEIIFPGERRDNVSFHISLPDASYGPSLYNKDNSFKLNLSVGFGNLSLGAAKIIPNSGNGYFFDCSQAIDFVISQDDSYFGECDYPYGTVTLIPVHKNTGLSLIRSSTALSKRGKLNTIRSEAGGQCRILPEDALQMTSLIQSSISNLDTILNNTAPVKISRKATITPTAKIAKDSAKSLSKSLKQIAKLLKDDRQDSSIEEFFPKLAEQQIIKGQEAIKAGKKEFSPKVRKTLLKLNKHLKDTLTKLEVIASSQPKTAKSESSTDRIIKARQSCVPPKDPGDLPIPPTAPPIPDIETGFLSNQPFEYCLGSGYELGTDPDSCVKDQNGFVKEIRPSRCSAPGDPLPYAICTDKGGCAAKIPLRNMSVEPIIATNNCQVAARDWCSMLARREYYETKKEHFAPPRAQCLPPQRSTDRAVSDLFRASLPPESITDVPNCVSYPRFPTVDTEKYCVRLSDINYDEFKAHYNNLSNQAMAVTRFAINGATLILNSSTYLFSLGEKYGDMRLETFEDPNVAGLPVNLVMSFASACTKFDNVWDAMACVSQRVKSGYDNAEIRAVNNEWVNSCSEACIVCRHYGSSFTQVCNALSSLKGWTGKVDCKNAINSTHLWPLISVRHGGETFSYAYDITNDWGCMDLIEINNRFTFIPNPDLK